jgi:DNA-directed RNA polymerase subunit RPC12/RpoP
MSFLVPDLKCPACGGKVLAKDFKAGKPRTCSACSRQFRISRTYKRTVVWTLLLILFAFFSSQGVRGWQLFVLAVVFLFPALMAAIAILYRVMPPRLEPYQPVGLDNGSERPNSSTSQPPVKEKKNPLGGSDDALL